MKLKRTTLDKLFSQYIRARANWRCERCGNKPAKRGLHTHHHIRRRNHSVRWDPDNCFALCYGCHQYLSEHPEEDRQFAMSKLGDDRYQMLRARANIVTKPDMEAIRLWLEQELQNLGQNEGD